MKHQPIVIFSFCLFFILSNILFFYHPTKYSCFDIDSSGYDRIGQYFAKTGCLDDPDNPGQATVQTVGYHFFVGIFYRLFGRRFWPIIWFQVLLTLFSCLLVFKIAQLIFDTRVAAISLLFCSFNIGFLVYSQFLLAEALTLFLLLFFLYRYVLFWRSNNFSHLVQAGLVGGFSLLVKPSAFLFLIFAAAYLLFFFSKRRIYAFFLFSICFMAPLFGYLTYNKVWYGYFNLAPMKSLNIYYVFLSKVIARADNVSVQQAEEMIPRFNAINSLDERGWDGARRLFWQYAFRHPFSCFSVWAQNVSKTVFGLFSTQLKLLLSQYVTGGDVSFFAFSGSVWQRLCQYVTGGAYHLSVLWIAIFEAVWTVLRYFLVMLGFLFLLFCKKYRLAFFCFSFIVAFSVVTGFDGCCRYRILFEPILLILSSFSLVSLYTLLKHKKNVCEAVFENNVDFKACPECSTKLERRRAYRRRDVK